MIALLASISLEKSMADVDRHLNQWQHNRDFVQELDPKYNDWIITGLFYASLHAVDALLAHKGNTATDHASRNGILSETNSYSKIWGHYRPLYSLSREIRYMANPQTWLPADQISGQIIKRYVYPPEKSVLGMIAVDLNLPPIEIRSES